MLPFDIRGSSDLGYLRNGLMDVLAARLNGMGELTTVDPHAVLERLGARDSTPPPPEAAWQLAESFQAALVVRGSLVRTGDQLEIRAGLHDAGGRRIGEVRVSGTEASLPTLINDLTRGLLAERLRGAGRGVSSLAALTSDSLEALQAFLRGEQAMREGRIAEAIEHFDRSVTIDTLFALGFYRLGEARNRSPGQQEPWWERGVHRTAARLADRLPGFERELVRTGTLPSSAALPILRELTRRRSTSAEAWYRLGMVLDYEAAARGTANTEAIAALSRARELDRGHFLATRGLAYAVARAGEWSRLQRLERELANVSPDDALLARAYLAFGRGDSVAIRTVVAELHGSPEPLVVEAGSAVTTLTRRPADARRLYGMLAGPERSAAVRARAHLRLADLAMAEGRWREAAREIGAAERASGTPFLGKRARMHFLPHSPLSPDVGEALRRQMLEWVARRDSPESVARSVPGLGYNAAMISVGQRDSAGIREAVTLLQSLDGMEDERRLQQLIPSLEAEIARIAGDAMRVVELLSAVPDPNSNQRYVMAHALEQLGRDEEAIRWYQSYPDLDANAPGQLGWRAASLMRLGDLHERRGERDRARAVRQEFLLLWQEADPEMQSVVAQVRAKLLAH